MLTSRKVGILKGRIYDASVVTKGGGYVVVNKQDDLMPGIFELIDKLREDEIFGFVADKYTYIHLVQEMHKLRKSDQNSQNAYAEFFLEGTHLQEIKRSGENLGYGMLMKNNDDYEYLKHFISDNRPIIQTCKELKMQNMEPPHHDENATHNIFNPNSGLFMRALLFALMIIGGIFLLGLFYEIGRWKMRQETKLICMCLNSLNTKQ